jgi:hypothetical protein
MSFRSRRHLETKVAEAIEHNHRLECEKRDALERAKRADDIRGGILALHQPHAQMTQDVGEPSLYCTACASAWPCETVEFVFRFGRHAPAAELTAAPE